MLPVINRIIAIVIETCLRFIENSVASVVILSYQWRR